MTVTHRIWTDCIEALKIVHGERIAPPEVIGKLMVRVEAIEIEYKKWELSDDAQTKT